MANVDELIYLLSKELKKQGLLVSFGTVYRLAEDLLAAGLNANVRCKECKHWRAMDDGRWMTRGRTDGLCLMSKGDFLPEGDFFCGYGERRTE